MFDDVVRCTVQELPKINWFEDDVLSLSLAPIISNAPKIGAREIIILERNENSSADHEEGRRACVLPSRAHHLANS